MIRSTQFKCRRVTMLSSPPTCCSWRFSKHFRGGRSRANDWSGPDGTICLGFYGDVDVAGLNLTRNQDKISGSFAEITLSDEVLGLVEMIPTPAIPRTSDLKAKPEDSDRVFVDVTSIQQQELLCARGLHGAWPPAVHREADCSRRRQSCRRVERLGPRIQNDALSAITSKGTVQGNAHRYRGDVLGDRCLDELRDGARDRLVCRPGKEVDTGSQTQSLLSDEPAQQSSQQARGQSGDEPGGDGPTLRDLDRRLSQMERKLETILKKLEDRGR